MDDGDQALTVVIWSLAAAGLQQPDTIVPPFHDAVSQGQGRSATAGASAVMFTQSDSDDVSSRQRAHPNWTISTERSDLEQ